MLWSFYEMIDRKLELAGPGALAAAAAATLCALSRAAFSQMVQPSSREFSCRFNVEEQEGNKRCSPVEWLLVATI
jgi:hypothetical protein